MLCDYNSHTKVSLQPKALFFACYYTIEVITLRIKKAVQLLALRKCEHMGAYQYYSCQICPHSMDELHNTCNTDEIKGLAAFSMGINGSLITCVMCIFIHILLLHYLWLRRVVNLFH